MHKYTNVVFAVFFYVVVERIKENCLFFLYDLSTMLKRLQKLNMCLHIILECCSIILFHIKLWSYLHLQSHFIWLIPRFSEEDENVFWGVFLFVFFFTRRRWATTSVHVYTFPLTTRPWSISTWYSQTIHVYILTK